MVGLGSAGKKDDKGGRGLEIILLCDRVFGRPQTRPSNNHSQFDTNFENAWGLNPLGVPSFQHPIVPPHKLTKPIK